MKHHRITPPPSGVSASPPLGGGETSIPSASVQIERMQAAYGHAGDGAQKRLAQSLGEQPSTVSSWVMRDSVPMRAFMRCAADTGRTLDWLVRGAGRESQLAISSDLQTQNAELKFSSSLHDQQAREAGAAAGGTWSLLVEVGRSKVVYTLVPKLRVDGGVTTYSDDGPVGEFAFQKAWMERHFGRAAEGFCLVDVSGPAMAPTFLDGDSVLVDQTAKDVDAGGIFVVRRGSELLIRRIHRQLSGQLQVSADNPAVLPEVLPADMEPTIIGRVVWPRSR